MAIGKTLCFFLERSILELSAESVISSLPLYHPSQSKQLDEKNHDALHMLHIGGIHYHHLFHVFEDVRHAHANSEDLMMLMFYNQYTDKYICHFRRFSCMPNI